VGGFESEINLFYFQKISKIPPKFISAVRREIKQQNFVRVMSHLLDVLDIWYQDISLEKPAKFK